MRISINLASRPFVELGPLFARLRLAMAALALIAVGLGIGLHAMSGRARVARAQMDALKAQTTSLENERRTAEARLREPENRAVLERSTFLNDLFTEKSFSWTSVMMDLENVLPAGVQVTSIEPSITAERNVDIRLRVSGDRERAVDLIRNLERSRRFVSPRPANETAQTESQGRAMNVAFGGPTAVEFDILSGYNPLSAAEEQAAEKKSAAKKEAGAGANKAAEARPVRRAKPRPPGARPTDRRAAEAKRGGQ